MNLNRLVLFIFFSSLTTISLLNAEITYGCTNEFAVNYNVLAELDDGSCEFERQLGDVNLDGIINVLDIIITINFMVNDVQPTEYEQWAADMNGNGIIGPEDIPLIVEIIMNYVLLRREDIKSLILYTESNVMQAIYSGSVASVLLIVSGEFDINDESVQNGWVATVGQSRDKILVNSMNGQSLETDFLFTYSGELNLISAQVGDWNGNRKTAVVNQFVFGKSYPNPFNGSTIIDFYCPQEAMLKIEIFDIQGKFIDEIAHDYFRKGPNSIHWTPNSLPSGIYLARLSSNRQATTHKIVYMK